MLIPVVRLYVEEHRSAAPNVDSQSLLHSGEWPFGRGNHYLYDLNRDFYFAANPESRGCIKAINQWYPLLMIDGHEMGSQDTYLFGPPRDPINNHIPNSIKSWGISLPKNMPVFMMSKTGHTIPVNGLRTYTLAILTMLNIVVQSIFYMNKHVPQKMV